jgi:formylglycine-generating enzyme required for sulfatase activity
MGRISAQPQGFAPSPYIYRLRISDCTHINDKKVEINQTGFRVEGIRGIVTALHGLVNCSKINAVSEAPDAHQPQAANLFTDLSIRQVDVSRDVALLSSSKIDALPADGLAISDGQIDYEDLAVIGYPLGLQKQRPLANVIVLYDTTLEALIPPRYLTTDLIRRASPDLKVTVFSVQASLVPGHSGAPLLDSNLSVIGIANGGLDEGRIEMGWAIPYKELRWASKDAASAELRNLRALDPNLALYFSSTYLSVDTPIPDTTRPALIEPKTQMFAGIPFVFIAAGKFQMGIPPASVEAIYNECRQYSDECERQWFEDQAPQHVVHLDDYWIMQTEVTNAQWQQYMSEGGQQPTFWADSRFNSSNQPVVGVNWHDAQAYADWLSHKAGVAIRLPTEAEWEKAARGVDGRLYPWGNDWNFARINYCDMNCRYNATNPNLTRLRDRNGDDGYAWTSPVGSYSAGVSPYGIFDMAGNVWEWTQDWYGVNYYALSPASNPLGPPQGAERVIRGGSFHNYFYDTRSDYRAKDPPETKDDNIGFRLVATPR